jgi:hypothetical protein
LSGVSENSEAQAAVDARRLQTGDKRDAIETDESPKGGAQPLKNLCS